MKESSPGPYGQGPLYCPWHRSPQETRALPKRKGFPGWLRALWTHPGQGILPAEWTVSLAAGRLPSLLEARGQRIWWESRSPREHLSPLCCSSPPAPLGIPCRAPHSRKPGPLSQGLQARSVSMLPQVGGQDTQLSLSSWDGFPTLSSSSHLAASLQSLSPGSLRAQQAPLGSCPCKHACYSMPSLQNKNHSDNCILSWTKCLYFQRGTTWVGHC